jgi:chaperone modulatory protein CbpM
MIASGHMISIVEFCAVTKIERPLVERWVAAGWLIPPQTDPEPAFAEIDVARARLICELRGDFGVNDEGVDLILHLLDQVYDLRRVMGEVRDELNRRKLTDEP